ncbi:MAG: DUF2493 domain-containing protein [Clostridia bacterium]|nr:DUF2493 domain-containing protein [Clostridia bacterium]
MKVAIIGSRGINIDNLVDYLPEGTDEIVSGGAKGVDTCAREYANNHGIKLTEFLPQYKLYGRGAHLKRNHKIIEYADTVLAFWDGESKGTAFVIENCKKLSKEVRVIIIR